MARGMSNWGTYRQGRTVRIANPGAPTTCGNFCVYVVFLALFLVAVPCLFLWAEIEFRSRVLAFNEAGAAGVMECKASVNDVIGTSLHTLEECAAHAGPAHIASNDISGTVGDDAFGVMLDKALQVSM